MTSQIKSNKGRITSRAFQQSIQSCLELLKLEPILKQLQEKQNQNKQVLINLENKMTQFSQYNEDSLRFYNKESEQDLKQQLEILEKSTSIFNSRNTQTQMKNKKMKENTYGKCLKTLGKRLRRRNISVDKRNEVQTSTEEKKKFNEIQEPISKILRTDSQISINTALHTIVADKTKNLINNLKNCMTHNGIQPDSQSQLMFKQLIGELNYSVDSAPSCSDHCSSFDSSKPFQDTCQKTNQIQDSYQNLMSSFSESQKECSTIESQIEDSYNSNSQDNSSSNSFKTHSKFFSLNSFSNSSNLQLKNTEQEEIEEFLNYREQGFASMNDNCLSPFDSGIYQSFANLKQVDYPFCSFELSQEEDQNNNQNMHLNFENFQNTSKIQRQYYSEQLSDFLNFEQDKSNPLYSVSLQ